MVLRQKIRGTKENSEMQRILSKTGWLVVAAALVMGFTACSSTEDGAIENPHQPLAVQTYTITVEASKSDSGTRALSLDNKTLNATWAEGEEVTVYNETKSETLTGTLIAQGTGANTILKGTLTGTIEKDDVLTLKFLSPTYGTQDGTLTGSNTSIDKVCDYAEATVHVANIDGSNITITESSADFQNKQAIVKFTLKNHGGTAISASRLTVNDGTNNYIVTPTSATDELFVAIPATNTVTLTVTDPTSKPYIYEKTGAGLVAGKYYEIGVKMSVYLDNATTNVTLADGDVVVGELKSIVQINMADDATVTLNNVTINGVYHDTYYRWAGINCLGDATIILQGTNVVKGFNYNFPGICVPENHTLTIQGDGVLNASSNGYGAGIGGGYNIKCGNIKIMGGTITAIGGTYAAGIGGGSSGTDGKCGNIEICGGTINATGGEGAAGIGAGSNSRCGTITISGGNITAQGGRYAAGIGSSAGTSTSISGNVGVCQDITITGGTIVATGGDASAGIGGGKVCGDITISGANITATKGSGAPYSIGAGNDGYCGTVTINGVEGPVSTNPYTFSVTDLSAAGNANTYIVSSAGTYKFDATVKGNGGLDPLTGTTATKIDKSSIAGVKVLWEVYDKGRAIKHDGTKYDISYNDGYVYFSTPNEFTEGDCYVAVYDAEDNILWSWLIWAAATPSEQAVGSDKFMNCNLGSIQVAYCTRGFLYEWGRKDPFPSTKYNNNEPYDYYPARMTCYSFVTSSQSVSYATQHPTTYIPGAWVTEDDYRTDLWSDTQKTIYDPCPVGWRVPTSSQMSSFKSIVGLGNLPATGFTGGINSEGDFGYGNPGTGYYWSSTGVNRSNALASCNDGRLNQSWPVNEGYAIRPVKE